MNALERLLQDELNRLLDRIAVRAGDDSAGGLKSDLRAPIERCEDRLTALRGALLDGYSEWARTIEEYEDLCAVAGLRKDGAESPARISRSAACATRVRSGRPSAAPSTGAGSARSAASNPAAGGPAMPGRQAGARARPPRSRPRRSPRAGPETARRRRRRGAR